MNVSALRGQRPVQILTGPIVSAAVRESLVRLTPRVQFRNPVLFVVFVGSIFTTIIGVAAAAAVIEGAGHPAFVLAIATWLWLTVLFANFAEAVAEGRGKAQAATLRSMRKNTYAKKITASNRTDYKSVEASTLSRGDLVLVETGDTIPADGE